MKIEFKKQIFRRTIALLILILSQPFFLLHVNHIKSYVNTNSVIKHSFYIQFYQSNTKCSHNINTMSTPHIPHKFYDTAIQIKLSNLLRY